MKEDLEKKVGTHTAPQPQQFPYQLVAEYFLPCPFCGNTPNVYQVPENRYGDNAPFGWVVECKDMGCIFSLHQDTGANTGDQSLQNLIKRWNSRTPKLSQW
jgi:hypothetical protein